MFHLLKQSFSCVSTLLDLKSVKSVQNQWRWCDEANNNPIMLRGLTPLHSLHSASVTLDSVSTLNSPGGSWQAMTNPARSFQWCPNTANSWWHSTVVPRLVLPSEDTCYSGPVGLNPSPPPHQPQHHLRLNIATQFLFCPDLVESLPGDYILFGATSEKTIWSVI